MRNSYQNFKATMSSHLWFAMKIPWLVLIFLFLFLFFFLFFGSVGGGWGTCRVANCSDLSVLLRFPTARPSVRPISTSLRFLYIEVAIVIWCHGSWWANFWLYSSRDWSGSFIIYCHDMVNMVNWSLSCRPACPLSTRSSAKCSLRECKCRFLHQHRPRALPIAWPIISTFRKFSAPIFLRS